MIHPEKSKIRPFSVKLIVTWVAILVSITFQAIAAIEKPVSSIEDLEQPLPEEVIAVETIKVIIADYVLIRKDFPQTRKMSDDQINDWLIKVAGFISIPQTEQTIVNTPIQTGSKRTGAYRPFGYNRALVYRVGANQYIDAKGVGAPDPKNMDQGHSNGIATLEEMLREFITEKKAQQILVDAKSKYRTVGCYAVFDLGFDGKFPDGAIRPAGAVLRQAHRRFSERHLSRMGNNFLNKRLARDIELIYRRYGLTSSREGEVTPFGEGLPLRDVVNVQGNQNGEIFDFGSYRSASHFSRDTYWYPEVTLKDARPLLRTTDRDFVQPDANLRIPLDRWGRIFPKNGQSYEAIRKDIRDLVEAYRSGVKTRTDIFSFFQEKMAEGPFPEAIKYRNTIGIMTCSRMFL